MTFLSLLAALLLEQARPLRQGNLSHLWFDRLTRSLESHFNGGRYRHGVIAWVLAVLPLLAVTVAASLALRELGALAVWAWNVAVLYLTLGFRQFGLAFAEVERALRAGDLATARDRLGNWRGEGAGELDSGEIARVAIEEGLVASHRYLFGTLFWFVVLGPAGAILHRASAVLADRWGGRTDAASGDFGRFARSAFACLDWVPARLTALIFAIVGNFEDAVYCWREQSRRWGGNSGAILASGAGALGVKLGGPLRQDGSPRSRPELGAGQDPDPDHLAAAERLVWRALVLWMFLVLLVSLAHALG